MLKQGDRRAAPSRAELRPAALRLVARHSGAILATARRFSIAPEDAEDAYQRGLEILLTKAPTTREDELVPWLRTVVKHEALAIRRHRERAQPTDQVPDQPTLTTTDQSVERMEQLQRGAEAMSELKPQEVQCLLLKAEGLSYREISAATGFSYTKVNRCLTEGRRAFTERLARIESGAECERLSSTLSAFSDGETTAAEETSLRQHLRTCLYCRARLAEFRRVPATAAAVLPIPLASAAAPDRVAGLVERAGDWASSAASSVKEQIAGLAARTPAGDSGIQLAASARPGAMAATVAACVAIGGGATYCATSGVPEPIKDLAGAGDQADSSKPDDKENKEPVETSPAATPDQAQDLQSEAGQALDQANSGAAPPPDSSSSTTESSAQTPAEQQDAGAQQELGIEQAGSGTSSSSSLGPEPTSRATSSTPSSGSAPASGGSGEFGP